MSQTISTEVTNDSQLTLASLQRWIIERLGEEIPNPETIDAHTSIKTLAIDSLNLIGLAGELAELVDLELPAEMLWEHETAEKLSKYIFDQLPESSETAEPQVIEPFEAKLISLKPEGSLSPIFLIHDGAGYVFQYKSLAKNIESNRPVYGIIPSNWGQTKIEQPDLKRMAADYVKAVRSVQQSGPYILGGNSLGAIIAFEMAQQMQAAGDEISSLLMIEPVAVDEKFYRKQSSADSGSESAESASYHVDNLKSLMFSPGKLVNYGLTSVAGKLSGKAMTLKRDFVESFHISGKNELQKEWRDYYFINFVSKKLSNDYEPQPYSGQLLLFMRDRGEFVEPSLGWKALNIGQTLIKVFETDHTKIMQPPFSLEIGQTISQHLSDLTPSEQAPQVTSNSYYSAAAKKYLARPIKLSGSENPLFLIHDAAGETHIYQGLADLIDIEQPIYGLNPPLDGIPDSIDQIASLYIDEIRAVQRKGPYRLGGYGFGGLVAFEIAKQLKMQRQQVEFLALFNPDSIDLDKQVTPHEYSVLLFTNDPAISARWSKQVTSALCIIDHLSSPEMLNDPHIEQVAEHLNACLMKLTTNA